MTKKNAPQGRQIFPLAYIQSESAKITFHAQLEIIFQGLAA